MLSDEFANLSGEFSGELERLVGEFADLSDELFEELFGEFAELSPIGFVELSDRKSRKGN